MNERTLDVYLAEPRGFCTGVRRAVGIVEEALKQYGAPVFVRHEIVHNKFVIENLRAKGAVFIDELAEVPDGRPVVFSAHGVGRNVSEEAERRGLTVLDATCPLVAKVHRQIARLEEDGAEIVVIGKKTIQKSSERSDNSNTLKKRMSSVPQQKQNSLLWQRTRLSAL